MTKQFLGSRDINESEEQHLEREIEWKEEHKCIICGDFFCDGSCEEDDYNGEWENEWTKKSKN